MTDDEDSDKNNHRQLAELQLEIENERVLETESEPVTRQQLQDALDQQADILRQEMKDALDHQADTLLRHFNEAIASIGQQAVVNNKPRKMDNIFRLTPNGDIPDPASLGQIWLQIWHKPNLTKQELRNFTHWSVSVEVALTGEGIAPVKFDFAMNRPQRAWEAARTMPTMHDGLRDMIRSQAQLNDPCDPAYRPDLLIGVLRASPPKGGRPYSPNQAVIMFGHQSDKPHVILYLEGEEIAVTQFKRNAHQGSKFFGTWNRRDTAN